MSYDIIPTKFRAEIIEALRARASEQRAAAPESADSLLQLVADLDANEFSSNKISVTACSGRENSCVVFTDGRNVDSNAAALSSLLSREVSEDEAENLLDSYAVTADTTDLTYHLETIVGHNRLGESH